MTIVHVPADLTFHRARPALALARVLSRLQGVPLLRWAGEAAKRREERLLLAEIRRLEELSPHLLGDIGVRQMARDSYVVEEDGFYYSARHGAHLIAERGPGLASVFR